MATRQLPANAFCVLAISPAGLGGGSDEHVRDPAHGRDDHYHFAALGVFADNLSRALHPLGIAEGCAAEFHNHEWFGASHQIRFFPFLPALAGTDFRPWL